jgi:tripartite-type tricarboxylate transporter receptor subunit TctC
LTPRRLAAAKAALVRSLIAARSCSATAARMWTVSKNTPADIVDKLNREINAGLADPKMQARLADLGGTALALSPPDFGKLIADETEKWGKVVKFLGIKAD